MNKKSISRQQRSKSDWKRVDEMKDKNIQFDADSPRTTPEDWADALVHTGVKLPVKKTQIALRVDDEVLRWFREQGPGYQTRINAILKAYKAAHEQNRRAGE